jgi:hypothetical protein
MAGKGRKAFWDDRREKFAQALAAGFKPEDAGKLVEYSPANSRRNARRKDVVARVIELRAPAVAKLQEKLEINIELLTKELLPIASAIIETSEIKAADKLRALEDLAKLHGLNAPEKRDVTVRDADQLTDDELARIAARGGDGAAAP